MTAAEIVLEWIQKYRKASKVPPSGYEIEAQLEMAIEKEKSNNTPNKFEYGQSYWVKLNKDWEVILVDKDDFNPHELVLKFPGKDRVIPVGQLKYYKHCHLINPPEE